MSRLDDMEARLAAIESVLGVKPAENKEAVQAPLLLHAAVYRCACLLPDHTGNRLSRRGYRACLQCGGEF